MVETMSCLCLPAKPAKLETFGEIFSDLVGKKFKLLFHGPEWPRKFLIVSHLVETLPQKI